MRSLPRLASLAVALVLSAQAASAQEPRRATIVVSGAGFGAKPPDEALRRRARADATARLPKLVRRARGIADAADRARVLKELADAEWDRDRALARRLYVEAFDAAGELRTEPSLDPLRRPSRAQIRPDLVVRISWHDAGLARDLLDRSAREPGGGFGAPDDSWPHEEARADALAKVAYVLYDAEPAEALRLARESLRYGVSSGFGDLLGKLFVADPPVARELASAAIERTAAGGPVGLSAELVLGEFARAGSPGFVRSGRQASEAGVKTEIATAYLEATRLASERVLDADDTREAWAASVYGGLTELMPAFERFDAEHAAEARADLARAARAVDPLTAEHYFYDENGDTWQGLEAEAAGLRDPGERRCLLEFAARLARDAEPDEAMRLAELADAVHDPSAWYSAVDDLLFTRSLKALQEGRAEDAIRLTSAVSNRAGRAEWLVHLCRSSKGALDADRVARILDEVETEVLARGTNLDAKAAHLHLEIASLRASADRATASAAYERAIRSVNVFVRTPFVPQPKSGFPGDRRRDPVETFGGSLTLPWFGLDDYFEALRLARLYEDPALEILAELRVVRIGLPPVGQGREDGR